MGLRYEAWTLPWDTAGFTRKFHWLPTIEGTGRGTISFLTTQGEGAVDVPVDAITAMGRTLDEIVSDTTSSLIRVYDCLPDGTNVIIDEWVCERPGEQHDDVKTVTLSGPPLKTKAFDGTIVYPFDYPTNPTRIPDFIWGGKNVLSNPDMEEGTTQAEIVELWNDSTGGTFTIDVFGETTSSLDWDATEGEIEDAIQALAGAAGFFIDVVVEGEGTEDAPWRIEFVTPEVVDPDLATTDSLTGGDEFTRIEKIQEGRDDIPVAWTTSTNPDTGPDPRFHGTYASDGFRLTHEFEPVWNGTRALRVNGLTRYAGAQQIVQVEPGMTYQFSVRVLTSDSTETFKFVLRDAVSGKWLTQDGGLIAGADTWTEYSFEYTIPDDVDTVIFRIAQTQDHNPLPFYVDRAQMLEGAAVAPWGRIVNVLMDDMTLDHAGDTRGSVLGWVDYSTVGDLVDSDGNTWIRFESLTVQFGESLGQVWDKGVDLGYEWNLVAKSTPVGGWDPGDETHDLVWYETGEMDDNPSTAINPGPSVTGGQAFSRTPAYTRAVIEGAEGAYVEIEDATLLANFGPMEKYEFDSDLASTVTLTAKANHLFAYQEANQNAVHFQMVENPNLPRPLVHFKPGDTIPMQQPPRLPKIEKRVQDISYVNTLPTQYMVTGSRVLQGEAAAYNLLWRLWRRLNKPQKPRRSGALLPTNKGGVPRVVLAAGFGASALSISKADFGKGDGLEPWDAVLTGEAGEIRLTEGSFVGAPGVATIPDGTYITGAGQGGTWIQSVANDWTFEGDSGMRFLTFDGISV